MAESLAEFFTENFQAHQTERAYGQPQGYRMKWFTYGQVMEMAVRFARELEARKIGKGERVMVWGENCAQWVAAFYGSAMGGAVVVPMDDGASSDFALRVFQRVGAKLLVCNRTHAAAGSDQKIPAASTLLLEDLPQAIAHHRAAPTPDVRLTRDDTLQIVFTSGTTAQPRGVVITHGNVLANAAPLEEQIRGYLKYERLVHPVRFLNLLPLSHVFGQFLGLFLPPLLGGTVIFQEKLKPSEIIQTIRRERVSVLVSVPRVLQSLKQKVERDMEDQGERADFQKRFRSSAGRHFMWRWWMFRKIHRQLGWKFWAFISGGAALDSDTEEFWERLGYATIQGYGLTETTSLISVNHPFRLGKGSIGKVLPGREVKLEEDGEILVRGGAIAAGYWNDGSEQREDGRVSDDAGWYRTGDIGAFDQQGNLYFKGRKKEVIVTPGGTNVYPEDLEAALRRQPEVKDCVVVGIERSGNAEPCGVLILRDHSNVAAAVARANQSLAEYQRIRMWMEWPEEDFPRTSTQKPKRNLVREVAQARIFQPAANSGDPLSPLLHLITSVAGRPISALRADANLDSDLGLSSLDRVELLSALEDRYQLDLSETRFSSARTVGDLEQMVRGEAVQRAPYHYPAWTLRWPATWLRFAAHYSLLRPAMMLLGWPRIEGRENLRGWNGPLLVVSNHIADVDVGFIQVALPARFRHRLATATGGEALEALRMPPPARSLIGRISDRIQWMLGVTLLNLFPLPREAGFRQSFAYAGGAVDRGYSVLVFPEGRHTLDGKMNPFRAGIGLLAQNLRIPVLPVHIDGLFELKQAGRKFAPPGKIRVRIGTPVQFVEGKPVEQITRELERTVDVLRVTK